MKRHLLSVLAVAAVASVAGAQDPAPVRKDARDTTARAERTTTERATTERTTGARRHTTTSRGEVSRRSGAGYSTRAVARDYVGAEDTRGDDLWRREQMMDQRCGKDRDRCPRP